MIILFSFAYDPERKEAAMSGNVPAAQALRILQGLVIQEAVDKASQTKSGAVKSKKANGGKTKP